MTVSWSREQLGRINQAGELQIASYRADGTLRRWVPIWVVCADDGVYVRSWYRRSTGWFGAVLDFPHARIRVPGLETDVLITDLGDGPEGLRSMIDAVYRTKYGDVGHQSMVTNDAAATTLRLDPIDTPVTEPTAV
ncbi:MAG TPA: DUF2255 family protein [Acidothermaceae bacterium]|jgi:hypothetical protein|nr:DUF2255 family protein [Acidothermaceae bacterium]